jgi:hypothetical protein
MLVLGEAPRKDGESPARNGGHRLVESIAADPHGAKEAEKHPQRRGDLFR